MARIRTIKPEFFDDEHLCELPFEHRLCFIGLWTQADKAGRMEDRPKRLKARIFPFDDVDMDGILSRLAREGFIVRYRVDEKPLLAIKPTSWIKHQRPRQDEPETVLPQPLAGTVTGPSLRRDESVAAESLGKEGKGREEGKGRDGSSEPPDGDSEPPAGEAVAVFPVVGKGGPSWTLSEAQVASWRELYPTIDVLREVRKALAWCAANPGRRKTAKGMPAFLVNWLNKATNDTRGGSGRAYSDFEVRKFEDWRRAMGGCGHSPRCESRDECIGQFVGRLRGAA